MKTVLDFLYECFNSATREAFPQLLDEKDLLIEITQSTQEKFGHYQFNSAMRLSKNLKLPPRSIAESIVHHVKKGEVIESLDIAGPGFINITLKRDYITGRVQKIANDSHFDIDFPETPQRIVVDFSSPNIAKELHVGHLRSTIIGDSLCRLFEFLGHNVLRLNHIGDWGTSFGMLIAYLKEEKPEILSGKEETDLTHLVAWYKAAKKRFDEDPSFKKKSQEEVTILQDGDPDSLKAWKIICEISKKSYDEIYALLDIKINDRGESFYNPMLPSIVDELDKKGLVTVSNGAKCIFLEGFQNREGDPLPLIIQKSDGGYNYATTDLAAMKHRTQEEHADRIVIVTDAGQVTHLAMIAETAIQAGYLNPKKTRFDHVTFGVVLGPDGKKFKTRSGETEKLIDLLTAAIDHAKSILKERDSDISEEEQNHLAKALGISAIKYADLSCHRTGDYTFSYDRMLRFDGNTAAYLMYSYVRIAGIKRKLNISTEEIKKNSSIKLEHPAEVDLGLHLMRFGEILHLVSLDLLPHRLTDYLYNLAEKFNVFFRDCRVVGSEEQSSRLLLCEVVAQTMKQGLYILGVETVERM